jgi:hypothetical protein
MEDLTLCGDVHSITLICQSKANQTREGVLLALDIETSLDIRNSASLAGIIKGYLLGEITGKRLNNSIDPGQISQIFKLLALKAELDPDGHSARIGTAQDLLYNGATIGQIMAMVEWSKVGTVMRYVGVRNIEAMNSLSNLQRKPSIYTRHQNSITI